MNLHTDMPTRAQVDRLLDSRQPVSVSIYLPTDPVSDGEAERIELGNLAGEAERQLTEAGTAKADVGAVADAIADLADDPELWRHRARSLAVFVTPESSLTFRLPNHLLPLVEVSDRFHVKPLLRAVTFPQVALVLALAQGSVRVVEITPDVDPAPVDVPGLPRDVASSVGKASIRDRSPSRRLQGAEGQKVRMRQFARQVDQALRPLLGGLGVPLILAAAEPLESIYRSVSTYPLLAGPGVSGSPEGMSDAELAEAARRVLDELNAASLRDVLELYNRRESESRAAADLAVVARAATFGAVDTVLVDIDESVPGVIDDQTGAIELDDADDAVNYGVVDEIARRVWRTGGTVLAVRREDVPGDGPAAAILRYALGSGS
jgi:Bacterial archaeo-eukaryotic release factor family 11